MSPDAVALATAHWPAAVRMARSWQRMDRTEAESDAGLLVCEIAQDYLDRGHDPAEFVPWLSVVLRLRLVDLWRSRHGRYGERPVIEPRDPLPWDPDAFDPVRSRCLELLVPPTDAGSDAVELMVDLLAAITTDLELHVVAGAYLGLTLNEIGETRGLTGSRMCKVRARLRGRDQLAGWRPQRRKVA